MGRKKGEKQYVTASEWIRSGGGKLPEVGKGTPFKSLPFNCCALSLLPFEDPVATVDGIVFDILNIVPYIKKHKKNPVTGEPLAVKDLIRLTFHKNTEGQYMCPITYKVFSDHSRIVFIKTSGHVYSMEAIEQLNVKTNNWTDLITGDKFSKKDIITIQDPLNPQKRDILSFKHYTEGNQEQDEAAPLANINLNEATTRIFNELKEKGEKTGESAPKKRKVQTETKKEEAPVPVPSMSFTCAGFTARPEPKREVKITKKKGYVRLHTTTGDINLELHCDMVPKACENFLLLCSRGYYNNTIFHRSIPGFMIQGGDPTGTGTGGQSAWGEPFWDEFTPKLHHEKRGTLCMANSGKDSNGSQFYITFAACKHLDNKHTIFGRVVGGMDVLDAMEAIPTDRKDKPLADIVIRKTTVFVNPMTEEAIEEERKEERDKEEAKKKEEKESREMGQWFSNPNPSATPATQKTGVGKYMATQASTTTTTSTTTRAPLNLGRVTQESNKRKRTPAQFDFSGW